MTDVQPRRPLPAKLAGHPSVRAVLARRESDGEAATGRPAPVLDAAWPREFCLAAGADDAPRRPPKP
ncbi:MAG: epoxyqueuosine reductase [Pseudonocardiales bacterium]|nr:epoxyqueuosine reductase [Pseudonocardiales bacterium]